TGRATRRAEQTTWEGGAADRFRAALADRQRECHLHAGELFDLATSLRGAAANYRHALARLDAVERRVRAVMVGGAGPALIAAGVTVASLPPSGSPQWDRVGYL